MKRCANCGRVSADDDAALCANCGQNLAAERTARKSQAQSDLPGCIVILLAVVDVVVAAIVVTGLFGFRYPAVHAPLWGHLVFYAAQVAVLAAIILVCATALRRGPDPRTRLTLLAATIVAALILGLGTACDVGLMSGS